MAKIIVRGKCNFSKKEIREAGNFFCKYLCKRLSYNLFVKIQFEENLYKKEKIFGYIILLDKPCNSRMFNIIISDNLSYKMTISTLAHEMIHVKQFARGELNWKHSPIIIWKNTSFNENYNYWKLPFEREAHVMENELYEKWIEAKKNIKKY